ncbi:ABC transporter permease [uncultured Paludibaculum sp.]|uniref:ABC transporter permease n=1 Tax=uncultured Paludibaculum sp. TaxID=1765020 RepID=UPI002AAAF268|nr:ABC transporter permease [uncultured Paludibaculum sp.]
MNIIRGILSDLRLAIRTCTRTPSFTITASLTLAVGIAATSTIFAMVNGVLLRSLPFGDPDRLVALYEHHRTIGKQGISAPDYEDWRNYVKSLQGLAAYTEANYFEPWLTGDGGPPEKIKATLASHNLLTVLDVHPQLGRDFTRSDDEGHENSVAIISDRFWQRRFQALPTIIGRSLALDGRSYTVIGVLPPSVRLPDWADVWIPLSNLDTKTLQRRQSHVLNGVGRLKSGVSMEHLASELDTIVSQLRQKYPLTNGPTTYECRPLRDDLSGELRSPLLALSLAVILVLVVASCNVASLLQTRYLAREAEFAIKRALGARASTILRQLVLESWVLSLVGATVGLVMTAGVIVVVRKLSGGHFVRADQLSIDASVVMFAMCLAVLTSVIAAFGPVAQLVRSEHASMTVLKSRAGTPVKRRRAFVFLAGQIAMSMAVVVVAGLLVHDFRSMVNKKLGFKRDDLVTLSISLRPDLYSNDIVVRRYYDNLLARIRAIPGVAASALVSTPLFTRNGGRFWIDGVSEPEPGNFPVAQVREISPEYFAAMGIALVRGRYLDDSDQAPGNVVINQTLARTYFPNDSAIGRFIILGVFGSQRIKHQVVGVVADATDADLSSKALPTFYRMRPANPLRAGRA